jgi:hypothetical protein
MVNISSDILEINNIVSEKIDAYIVFIRKSFPKNIAPNPRHIILIMYINIERIKLHSKKPGSFKFGRLTPGFNPKHFKEKWFLYNYYVLMLS